MTHISKKKLPKDLESLFHEALAEVLRTKSSSEAKVILSSLFTKTEKLMLSKRVITIFLLNEGLSTDQVAKATNTTRQTVLRVADQMRIMKDSDKRIVLNRLGSWSRKNMLKNAIKSFWELNSPSKAIRDKARKVTGW